MAMRTAGPEGAALSAVETQTGASGLGLSPRHLRAIKVCLTPGCSSEPRRAHIPSPGACGLVGLIARRHVVSSHLSSDRSSASQEPNLPGKASTTPGPVNPERHRPSGERARHCHAPADQAPRKAQGDARSKVGPTPGGGCPARQISRVSVPMVPNQGFGVTSSPAYLDCSAHGIPKWATFRVAHPIHAAGPPTDPARG